MSSLCSIFGELSPFVDTLFDLVLRSLFGDANNFRGLAFPASGDDGNVDTLVLVLRIPDTLIPDSSFLALRFLEVMFSLRGVTLRLCFVDDVICNSSSLFSFPCGSDLSELRRVLRRCGVFVIESTLLCRDFVILRVEPAPIPGVGVELVTSLKGDFSRR